MYSTAPGREWCICKKKWCVLLSLGGGGWHIFTHRSIHREMPTSTSQNPQKKVTIRRAYPSLDSSKHWRNIQMTICREGGMPSSRTKSSPSLWKLIINKDNVLVSRNQYLLIKRTLVNLVLENWKLFNGKMLPTCNLLPVKETATNTWLLFKLSLLKCGDKLYYKATKMKWEAS